MNIVIVGSGNVATVFGRILKKAGHHIVQVFGRNSTSLQLLADELEAEGVTSWERLSADAELYLLAVKDHAIYEIAEQFPATTKIVVHTAGSIPMKVLEKLSPFTGVFYPLQTLRKELPVITDIPFLIDGNTPKVKKVLHDLAL